MLFRSDISKYTLGQVVRQRATQSTLAQDGDVAVKSSYQIMVRSTDTQGNAIGAIATVVIPETLASSPAVVSYQNFEDAVAFDCAPSWAFVAGEQLSDSASLAANLEGPIVAGWALASGHYVVIPDHEG